MQVVFPEFCEIGRRELADQPPEAGVPDDAPPLVFVDQEIADVAGFDPDVAQAGRCAQGAAARGGGDAFPRLRGQDDAAGGQLSLPRTVSPSGFYRIRMLAE